ncbi:MAG: hydroxymethylbilane synthase [Rhizobiales bacterium]|nr:hydroxymethylbilane synthase [Hyphomicrobiales bacterium]
MTTLKIGTRGSPLALAQAYETRKRLMDTHGLEEELIEIKVISTEGDRIQDKALRDFGGKGLFTKEIEEALLDGSIDLAVHSMKDVQTQLIDELRITAHLPREDVRDGFISRDVSHIDQLPEGAVVGTSSLRRQAQVKKRRPDLDVVTFRGSVQTRLEKLERGDVAATFLAVAGLKRLGLTNELTTAIETDVMLPAVAQGAIGIECRTGDERVESLVSDLNDRETEICVTAERAFLRKLDGSCRTPIAALAEIKGDKIHFRGEILAHNGERSFFESREDSIEKATEIGIESAESLITKAGAEFMASLVE